MIQCEYCPASYERKGSMKCHMSKYHPDKIVPDECEVQEKTDTTNQGNLLRGIDNCLDLAQSVHKFVRRPWSTISVTIFL